MPRGEHLAPAPVGNQLATKHGAYSVIRLAPRAEEIRAEIEELLPLRSDSDLPTVALLSMTLAQLERAMLVLGAAQAEETDAIEEGRRVPVATASTLARLNADARGWMSRAQRLLNDLGLSPHSRVRLGLEVVRTRSAVAELNAYLEAKQDG